MFPVQWGYIDSTRFAKQMSEYIHGECLRDEQARAVGRFCSMLSSDPACAFFGYHADLVYLPHEPPSDRSFKVWFYLLALGLQIGRSCSSLIEYIKKFLDPASYARLTKLTCHASKAILQGQELMRLHDSVGGKICGMLFSRINCIVSFSKDPVHWQQLLDSGAWLVWVKDRMRAWEETRNQWDFSQKCALDAAKKLGLEIKVNYENSPDDPLFRLFEKERGGEYFVANAHQVMSRLTLTAPHSEERQVLAIALNVLFNYGSPTIKEALRRKQPVSSADLKPLIVDAIEACKNYSGELDRLAGMGLEKRYTKDVFQLYSILGNRRRAISRDFSQWKEFFTTSIRAVNFLTIQGEAPKTFVEHLCEEVQIVQNHGVRE